MSGRSVGRFAVLLGCVVLIALALVELLSRTSAGQEPERSAPKAEAPKDAVNENTAAKDAFGLEKVYSIDLKFSADQWRAIQPGSGRGASIFPGILRRPGQPAAQKAKAQPDIHRGRYADFPWAFADLVEDGQSSAHIGIRYKGNATYQASSRFLKRSLKIELDHFDEDAPLFHGIKKLNLNAGVMDPTKAREAMAYAVFRAAGVPAPRTAFAEVSLSVPGQYDLEKLGLFTVVEQVDKPFLKDHFGSGKGLLMKPQLRGPDYLGETWSNYTSRYQPNREPTKEEAARVIEFARLVNNANDEQFRGRIGTYLDVDEFLRFIGVNALVVNLDGPFAWPHNYYIYLNPQTQRFVFMPWDLDLALAAWPYGGAAEEQMDLSLMHPHVGQHKLIDRLLAIPDANEKYRAILKELAAGCFSRESLLKDLDAIEKATARPLAADAQARAARQEGAGFDPPPGGSLGQAPDPRTFVEKRTESVRAQLEGRRTGYVPNRGF